MHSLGVPPNHKVDFARKVLRGTCTLTVEGGGGALVLDTRDLAVSRVHDADTNAALPHALGPATAAFGAPLTVELPAAAQRARVCVSYETSPGASGAQWLAPEQTCGKQHPYLFTQCQVGTGKKKKKQEITCQCTFAHAACSCSGHPCPLYCPLPRQPRHQGGEHRCVFILLPAADSCEHSRTTPR